MRLRPLPTLLVILLCFPALAQEPSTRPARRVVVPPGFEVIEQDGRHALAAAEDAAWVRAALSAAEPATQPTTMPADVVERLIERRQWLQDRLAADLLIDDPAPVAAFIDGRLLPRLREMEAAQIPLFYFVTTRARLKELLAAGWSDPRFYYNRAADEIMIQPRLELNFGGAMDDLLIPAMVEQAATAEQKRAGLVGVMRQAEGGLATELSVQAQLRLQHELLEFIEQQLMSRLDLKADQVWLRLGLVAALSAQYAGHVTGNQPVHFVAPMVAEPRNVRLRAANVDLLRPTDPTELRREYLPAYIDAMRRKSVAVVWDWLQEAKREDAVPRTLRAVLEQKPATGADLVGVIREATGVDLGTRLGPI